mmetsp:Transcript_15228/g.35295  ORF Transcript_15228/g.35295 Transcript_15228/m.35295 type:complete len:432 (+) Transcript_15228:245-1540(+)
MLGLKMTKKGWGGRDDDNLRSRSKSRERVALLGTSSSSSHNDRGSPMTKRRVARTTKETEMVSLLGGPSPGKSKREGRSRYPRTKRGISYKERWTLSRMMRYLAILILAAMLTYKLLRKESKIIHWEEYNNILEPKGPREARCFEESRNAVDERCVCPDPEKPLAREEDSRWKSNHERMVSQAKNAPKDLDIVFFGDGLIEQLSGSRDLGSEMLDGMEEYFERTFDRNRGSKFTAVALGSSGDTGPNLLWHWENGIKQANLRPKLWFIAVGGNDLYVKKCTDRFVKANVLNVAKRIFEYQEDAKIVIHGIIPRKDDLDSKLDALGHLWNRAQGVNLDVRKFIKTHSSRIYFMNLGQTLMAGGFKGRAKVNRQYIQGIYPTFEGMKKWTDMAAKKLVPILKGFDMAEHKKKAKEAAEVKKAQEQEDKDNSTN